MLQFSDSPPGTSSPARNPEWTVRSVAMILYYAEHAFYSVYGYYTDNLTLVNEYASPPILNSSCCTSLPVITLQPSSTVSNENISSGFVATMVDYKANYQASIRDDRYLVVKPYKSDNSNNSSSNNNVLSVGAIVGIVIGCVVFVGMIILAIILLIGPGKVDKVVASSSSPSSDSNAVSGAHGDLASIATTNPIGVESMAVSD